MIGGGEFFPDGTGATARLRAYALGLQRLGTDVRVLLLVSVRPDDWLGAHEVTGEWRGVPFEYMSGLARGQRGWVSRRLRELRAIARTCSEIVRRGREPRSTTVVLLGTSLRWILPIATACRWARVPLVHDRTEFPFVYDGEPGPLAAMWRRAYMANVFRLFDGVVVISTFLEDALRGRVRRGGWLMRIPILVDADAFDCQQAGSPGLVGYAGSLGHPEELAQLIEAVSIVRRTHPDTRLVVVGGGSERDLAAIARIAAGCGMTDAVEMAGFAAADRIPGLLCGCSVLALPRVAGLFSSAGMPTKLGEYLATGRPVVVTATGDIPLYLHDGNDALVVAPGDTQALAVALERALYDPASQDVGRAGRLLARREFDPATHMRRLLDAVAGGESRSS